MSRIAWAAAIFTVVLLAPIAAQAQATIAGAVSDNSGALLANVAVEVSGAALAGKVRTATTDEKGQYNVADLPAGTYTILFTRPGFLTLKREGVELSGTLTARVNAILRAGK